MIFSRIFKFLIPVFLVLLSTSCTNEKKCNEYMNSYLKLHFYSVYKLGDRVYVKDSTLKSISYSIESRELYDTVNVSSIYVPLSPHTDLLEYTFNIDTLPSDVVYIKYKCNQLFISYECGFRNDYTIDTLVSTQNRFDSIRIVQPQVSVTNEEHIKIYFHPSVN